MSGPYQSQRPDFTNTPAEQPLSGGFVSDAVLVGNTVRKRPPRDPDFVRHLLRHFEEHCWDGAPRFLGTDDSGREVLSFVDGVVPWRQGHEPPSIRSERTLAAVARQVRRFHDLTAGTVLAGSDEVVCHNDLSPKNTVYRDAGGLLVPVAFIDWDIAGPGERVHDVAHVCWQYVGLMWWQDRCWRGIEAAADAGEAAMIRLRDLGTVDVVRAAHDWTRDHRSLLQQAVTSS